MSQGSIIKYLRKCKKPKTAKEIAKALGVSSSGTSLKKLRNHGEIRFKIVKGGTYIYWIR